MSLIQAPIDIVQINTQDFNDDFGPDYDLHVKEMELQKHQKATSKQDNLPENLVINPTTSQQDLELQQIGVQEGGVAEATIVTRKRQRQQIEASYDDFTVPDEKDYQTYTLIVVASNKDYIKWLIPNRLIDSYEQQLLERLANTPASEKYPSDAWDQFCWKTNYSKSKRVKPANVKPKWEPYLRENEKRKYGKCVTCQYFL